MSRFTRSTLAATEASDQAEQRLQCSTMPTGYSDKQEYSDVVALVLAGGKGARLQPLTSRCCKPTVPFGGCFRIIDFTLSNCINSGIRRIGVLSQHKQQSLARHVEDGWSFLRKDSHEFIELLPARQRLGKFGYEGTADAVTQNLNSLRRLNPRYTLILAGDHIYKADYRKLIAQHCNNEADVTIACQRVPLETAHRFGVVTDNDSGRISSFHEKPIIISKDMQQANGQVMASMGVYVFNTDFLIEALKRDRPDPDSTHDFGRDVIPQAIEHGRVYTYDYSSKQTENYWRDVGTIDAYFETNMQLLDPTIDLELQDPDWPIMTGTVPATPARFLVDGQGHTGVASNCIVAPGSVLRGARIIRSIIFSGVNIEDQTDIQNSLVLPGATIGKRCRIKNAIIDSGVHIADDTEIGYDSYHDSINYMLSDQGIVVVSDSTQTATDPTREKAHTAVFQGPAPKAVASLDGTSEWSAASP